MMEKLFDGLFVALPDDLMASPCYPACPANAIKILLVIVRYWVKGGMKDNGDLIVTFKMLRTATGISSKNAIALGLRQLEALGMLIMNNGKWSPIKGQRQPNRYGLPWVPSQTGNGGPASKRYLEIRSREEANQRLEGLKEQRKDPTARKLRVVVEFEEV
jgi:hypothetical protein